MLLSLSDELQFCLDEIESKLTCRRLCLIDKTRFFLCSALSSFVRVL